MDTDCSFTPCNADINSQKTKNKPNVSYTVDYLSIISAPQFHETEPCSTRLESVNATRSEHHTLLNIILNQPQGWNTPAKESQCWKTRRFPEEPGAPGLHQGKQQDGDGGAVRVFTLQCGDSQVPPDIWHLPPARGQGLWRWRDFEGRKPC